MYPCTSPLLPSISRKKKHGFSSVFAKRTSKNIEFFQIFGKRMQEAQASKKAGRGNRAWDPCFATPAPRRLRLVERHQIAARYVGDPPPRGGVILYPLVSIRHAEQCRRMGDTYFWVHNVLLYGMYGMYRSHGMYGIYGMHLLGYCKVRRYGSGVV